MGRQAAIVFYGLARGGARMPPIPLFYEVRNSKRRKVRSWYIEAGDIHPHLSNRLLSNLPQATKNNS